MAPFVSDTGPLLHLLEIGAVELLGELGEVCCPPMVETELASHISGKSLMIPSWLRRVRLDPVHEARSQEWVRSGIIHVGEAEAIALAEQLNARTFFTDDAMARFFANSRDLDAHGSLGIVLLNAAKGRLSREQADELLNRLARSSLWLSQRVLIKARTALNAIFR